MFPKKDSDPYVKSTGERSTLGQMIGSGGGGGGSELPDYSATDAGKVLGVTESGELAWDKIIPDYSSEDAGKVLGVTEEGALAWVEVTGGGFIVTTNVASITKNITNSDEEVNE